MYHFSTSCIWGTLRGSLDFCRICPSRCSSSMILNHSRVSCPAPLTSCAVSARKPQDEGVDEPCGYTSSVGTLFSFACVRPGHLWMCRTLSDPVATLQYATPVPVASISYTVLEHIIQIAYKSCQSQLTPPDQGVLSSLRPCCVESLM